MGRRVVVVCCIALLALLGAGRASAFTQQEVTIPTFDGVDLRGTLYVPTTGSPPYPAVVLFHGIGGKRQDLDLVAQRFAQSFVVLSFDARGHGQSGGLTSIDGPNEIADARTVHDWLAGAARGHPERDRRLGHLHGRRRSAAVARRGRALERGRSGRDLDRPLQQPRAAGPLQVGRRLPVPQLGPGRQPRPVGRGDRERRAREHESLDTAGVRRRALEPLPALARDDARSTSSRVGATSRSGSTRRSPATSSSRARSSSTSGTSATRRRPSPAPTSQRF